MLTTKSVIRCATTILILTTTTCSFSQTSRYDSLESLASKITYGLTDPRKKLDAIFVWVTDNIAYDIEGLEKSLSGREVYPKFELEYTDSAELYPEYNEAVASMVIHRKKGICDGYAKLFKSLCNHSGIECEIVSGKTRKPLREELGLHAWNAVKIKEQWYLVDPTWASGYVSDKYVKERNMFYYLTPPEKMFVNHLPDEQKWTLLDKSFNSQKFAQSPVEDIRVMERGLTDYFPKKKTVNFQKGQLTTVWLEFDKSPTDYDIDISEQGPIETRATKLKMPLTDRVYDSLYNIDPDYFTPIKKIAIVSKKIAQNRIEFVFKPLVDIKGFHVYVNSGFPALTYNAIIYQKAAGQKTPVAKH